MEKEIREIKASIYMGMSIYSTMKNCKIKLGSYLLTDDDKKFLSLYLGLIKTKNKISERLNARDMENNISVKVHYLNNEQYMKIYLNDFSNIIDKINFDSIENYLLYLLDQNIVEIFNETNGINPLKNSNKQLIKK